MSGAAPRRIERAIDALRTDLPCRPDELRRRALDLVTELADGVASLWYELGMVNGEPYPVRHVVRAASRFGEMDVPIGRHREEEIPWPTVDPRFAPRGWNRSFVLLSSVLAGEQAVEKFRSTRLYRRVWEPARMVDQLRMVVYHRGEHVAWIGSMRRGGDRQFSRADQRRLAPIAEALADALITARAVERAGEPERGCDVLVTAQGKVLFASDAAERWLSRPRVREEVRAWTRRIDRGEAAPACIDGLRARWSRMHGGRAVRYLVNLERVAPVLIHPGAALSRTQREVARLAGAGATTTEIARMRGVSGETVRGQLKQIYELLGIASRAELGRVFADASSDAAPDDPPTIGVLRARARALKDRAAS